MSHSFMIRSLSILCLLLAGILGLYELASHAKRNASTSVPGVIVTVHKETSQRFAGFGISETNYDGRFEELPSAMKQSISSLVWHDLNFKILRLWFSPADYAANPKKPNQFDFKRYYIDSGIIKLAMQQGCTTLLLAPGDVPSNYAKPKASSRAAYAEFTDNGVAAYAALLAKFILQLKTETGVQITATGILNEPNDRPIRFTTAQWPMMVKALRSELDQRGLKSVAIIAPEAASCDDEAYGMVDAIKGDRTAWAGLQGIATHTYNMGATDAMSQKISGSGKSYWQTESSTPGPESLGDPLNAATSAGRVVSDLNHGVTHWIWFIGYEQDDPNDNGTRLIKYDAAKPAIGAAKFYKYYYIQQLSRAFPPGSIIHNCTSSAEGSMTWTYGTKPRILAASAQLPDGSWSVAVLNCTSNLFSARGLSDWERSQGGQPAKTFNVTLKIDALAATPNTTFYTRSSTDKTANADAGTLRARYGVVTLTVDPLELITLSTTK